VPASFSSVGIPRSSIGTSAIVLVLFMLLSFQFLPVPLIALTLGLSLPCPLLAPVLGGDTGQALALDLVLTGHQRTFFRLRDFLASSSSFSHFEHVILASSDTS